MRLLEETMEKMGIAVPQVSLQEVERFSQAWNKNGISLLLDNNAKEFARDFANVVLRSFVVEQYQRAALMLEAAEKAQKESLVTVD